jgi:hypothetical protein
MSEQQLPCSVYRVRRGDDGRLHTFEAKRVAIRGSWQTIVDFAGRQHKINGHGGWWTSSAEAIRAYCIHIIWSVNGSDGLEQALDDLEDLMQEAFQLGKLAGKLEQTLNTMRKERESKIAGQ